MTGSTAHRMFIEHLRRLAEQNNIEVSEQFLQELARLARERAWDYANQSEGLRESGIVESGKLTSVNALVQATLLIDDIYFGRASAGVAGLKLEGIEVLDLLKGLMQAVEGSMPDLIFDWILEPIYDRSQEYVPVDTGRLKASGYIETAEEDGIIAGEVGYAPYGDPYYATAVHEVEEWNHAPPTRAKYLEDAVKEVLGNGQALRDVIRQLKDILQRKGITGITGRAINLGNKKVEGTPFTRQGLQEAVAKGSIFWRGVNELEDFWK